MTAEGYSSREAERILRAAVERERERGDWSWPINARNYTDAENFNVTAYEAAEDTADNRDYRFFLLFVWIGGLVYLALAVLGVWKAVEVIGGLL